jgi:urea transporter
LQKYFIEGRNQAFLKVITMQKQTYLATTNPFFKGIGQIMLQENTWTGLFFLAGIFCGSFTMGMAAVFAVLTGTVTAKILKYNKEEINSGLYGFSAGLVGVALACMFSSTLIIWLAIFVGSVLAAVIQHFFIARQIPAFTFPFILVTWVLLFLFAQFPGLGAQQVTGGYLSVNNNFTALARGFGQVIFQDNIWSGLLFFIGVLICSPVAAIYGLVAAGISALMAYSLGVPVADIYLGLLGYNAVLCAITFAGKRSEDAILALVSVVLSVLITIQMRKMNLPALTFPFVLASWITLMLKQMAFSKRISKV